MDKGSIGTGERREKAQFPTSFACKVVGLVLWFAAVYLFADFSQVAFIVLFRDAGKK